MKMLTTTAFARELGVVPETVRRYVRDGKLAPAGRLPGGQMRFRPEQVEEFIKGGGGMTERAQDIEAHVAAALERARIRRRARVG